MDQSTEHQAMMERYASASGGGILGKWLRRNPVTLKELRGRMRGSRAFVVLSIYVMLMSGFATVLYLIYVLSGELTVNTGGGVIGKIIFTGIVVIELFLVCFIAPAFTSGAISGERERQTYDLLRTTLLPARRLVIGKLVSALAYVFLLLLVAIPLQSLAFLMGGVTIGEVLLSIELLLITAVGYGSIGVYFSAVTKRTLNASVLTYALALVLTVVLPIIVLILRGVLEGAFYSYNTINRPLIEGGLLYLMTLLSATNPISAGILTETTLLQYNQIFFYSETLSNGKLIPIPSPWIVYTLLYSLVSVILVRLSVRRVRRVE